MTSFWCRDIPPIKKEFYLISLVQYHCFQSSHINSFIHIPKNIAYSCYFCTTNQYIQMTSVPLEQSHIIWYNVTIIKDSMSSHKLSPIISSPVIQLLFTFPCSFLLKTIKKMLRTFTIFIKTFTLLARSM